MRAAVLAVAVLVGALVPTSASAATCPSSPFTAELGSVLAARYPGRGFSASVLDLRDGCSYELNPGRRMTTASVFKVEVLAGVLLRAQQEHRGLDEWEAARVRPMISQSADAPTNQLFTYLGGVAGFARLHRTFGLTETSTPTGTWGLTTTTARDQIRLLRQVLVGGGPLDDAHRRRARVEMTSVVPAQRWGVTEGVPAGWVVAQKNGFAGSRCCGWRLNSVGQVGVAWLATTFSDGWPSEAAGIEGNRFLNRAISTTLARVPVGPFPSAAAFVDRQFADALGRRPGLAERTAWTAAAHQGNPAATLAWLLGAPERSGWEPAALLHLAATGAPPTPDRWRADAHRAPGAVAADLAGPGVADDAWLAALYRRALGRAVDDGGRRAWTGRPRTDVLVGVALSTEHRLRVGPELNGLVVGHVLLGRTLAPAADRVALIRSVLASDEYRERVR